MKFPDAAVALGYKEAFVCESAEELSEGIQRLVKAKGPALMEVRVLPGARANLGTNGHPNAVLITLVDVIPCVGRPTTTTYENKNAFMKFLHN